MKFKRGQAARIFMYVLTIVVVGFVLLFGYKAISSLGKSAEAAGLAKFKNDMKNDIDIDSSYGTKKIHTYYLDEKYDFICFLSVKDLGALSPNAATLIAAYPLIEASVGSADNAFLVDDNVVDPFGVGEMEIEGGFNCSRVVNGEIRLRYEGKGDRTVIKIFTGP